MSGLWEKLAEVRGRLIDALRADNERLRGEVARLERANRGLVMFILRDHPDADLEAITEGGAE